jgi:hypothetical protein
VKHEKNFGRKNLEFILDANIYIFAFGVAKQENCIILLNTILGNTSKYKIRICRTTIEEVRGHLTPQEFREFIGFINNLTIIDEDIFVPFELGSKYEWKGLKPADAFIAAYTEWTGANILVTENRHFLSRQTDLPFKVLTTEKCLKLIIKTS